MRLYEGTHDFKAFGGQIEQNEKRAMKKNNTIRTVELVKEPLKEDYNFGNENDIVQTSHLHHRNSWVSLERKTIIV